MPSVRDCYYPGRRSSRTRRRRRRERSPLDAIKSVDLLLRDPSPIEQVFTWLEFPPQCQRMKMEEEEQEKGPRQMKSD